MRFYLADMPTPIIEFLYRRIICTLEQWGFSHLEAAFYVSLYAAICANNRPYTSGSVIVGTAYHYVTLEKEPVRVCRLRHVGSQHDSALRGGGGARPYDTASAI